MQSIITAAITAAATIIGQCIIARTNAKKDAVVRAARQQKLDDDIARLTQRVNEHNSYAALFAEQTGALSNLSTDIKLLQKDIEYLKKGLFNNGNANQ